MANNEKVTFNSSFEQTEETPVIIIEREDDEQTVPANGVPTPAHPRRRRWLWVAVNVLATLLVVGGLLGGYYYYRQYVSIGVPISCTPEENIEKLKMQTLEMVQPEVIMTTDSVLGVAMNMYEIRGLRAEITLTEPDTLDESVYLYCRCSDNGKSGEYLGSLVINGEEKQAEVSRLGYFASVGSQMVIGISRSEAVKDFVMENGGNFFRQFILVSNYHTPSRFFLHGKVERNAIGRKGETYYYIQTRYKETLWGFADALRQAGFTDAIYITGGQECYSYYRDIDGARYDIGSTTNYPYQHWKGTTPWLVFKK